MCWPCRTQHKHKTICRFHKKWNSLSQKIFLAQVQAQFKGRALELFCLDTFHLAPIKTICLEPKCCDGRTDWLIYRYDKSSNNFTYRKYTRTHHTIFDPVHAAVDIIERANLLQVNDEEPLGVAIAHNGGYRFLRDSDITRVLRNACVQAFPNEQHYLRQHIKRLVPHSNRVTAAVCMKQGGARDDEIAFRLRSVPTYLRDCFQAVGQALRTTLNGALLHIT